jgi:flagellar biosynthetic protein FliP
MQNIAVRGDAPPVAGPVSKRAFARHFAEMIVVMLLGMGVLEGLAAVAFAVAGSSLTDQPGALRVTLMGLSMTVPMVFWMRHRGHAAGRNVEMAASMLVPSAIAAALAAASVLSAGAALAVQHAVMVPAMLGVMLWHYEEYARPHAAPRGDPPCRAYPNEPATTRVPGA